MRRDKEITELKEQLKEVLTKLDQRTSSHRSERSKNISDSEEEEDSRHRNRIYKEDDRGLRLDIPEFDGSMRPENFLE